jgi:hypothetical protein
MALIPKDRLLQDYSRTWKLSPTHVTLIYLQPSTTYDSDLQCRLVEHRGFDPNQMTISSLQYAALSYTWGISGFNRTLYRLDGDNIMITENLDLALRKIRDSGNERILWVDAVCIDQHNLAERTFQVKTMNSVYYQADEVHAWLGEESESRDGEICFSLFEQNFNRIANQTAICHKQKEQGTSNTIQADLENILAQLDKAHLSNIFKKLFERKYFSRRWIIQEITFSRKLILHCGNST